MMISRLLKMALLFLFFYWLSSFVNPVEAAYQKKQTTAPRSLIIHQYVIDLSDPDLDVLVTPAGNLGTTTSKFLADFDLEVAVNGDEWTGLTNPKGLNASLGSVYSQKSAEPTMYISENNQVSFGSPNDKVFNAVSGSHTLVIGGKVNSKFSGCNKPEYCSLRRARTAVGLTNNNQLLLMVVEEGQPGISEGVSLVELAQIMIGSGANHAISLDGGGSSSMALSGQGLISYPSDGNERTVSNHLGFCQNCIDPDQVNPGASSLDPTNGSTTGLAASSLTGVQNPQPLRPFPNQLTGEEQGRSLNKRNPDLTVYCAQRPTILVEIDKRNQNITVQGNLATDVNQFVTPLLSITDDRKSDFALSDLQKSRQYLADYLEGRAYYEGVTEVPEQISLERLGVFRKLAPLAYQDELKHEMVKRATGDFAANESAYGFDPASDTVHNYQVTNGNLSATLSDFAIPAHLKPLPKEFPNDFEYQQALTVWQDLDNGKWSQLWSYVPMFSREDMKAFIEPVDEPGQNTSPDPIEVVVPHLARTYEVTSALSFILSPYKESRPFLEPDLSSQWVTPEPWENNDLWLDSSESKPGNWNDLGPVCDPQQIIITSSGDLAHDSTANTTVLKTVANPVYDPDCAKAVGYDPLTQTTIYDDSACLVSIRYSPTYLKTYTPYLHALMDRLLTGPNAVFNIFKPYSEVVGETFENWPGAASLNQENLAFSFAGGQAEAGLQKPPAPATYYFKYLGTIHCQKEKLMAKLQPFISGQAYEIDPQCTGGEAPTDGGPSIPVASCFQLVGNNWPTDFRDNLEAGINNLVSNHPSYVAKACAAGSIPICFDSTAPTGGWGYHHHNPSACDIALYPGGLGDQLTAEYILTHEVGHHLSRIAGQYYSQYVNYPGTAAERPICSYSATSDPSEAFAEAAALYGSEKPFSCFGSGSFRSIYPRHWQFANDVLFK
jgi:hypothetical protein